MGIKGIYKEIGTGKRISLTKLAVEKLEETGRPLRLAIDISIWQFQVQAARGGSNPAIRTLFYRLLRLLGLSIQPIFVFDGPNKPAFKRNKRSGRGDGVATSMAKRLIKLFGFQVHDAPGEAEAECALLQQTGIVDAVLSEDVDTIMFGCTRTLRNWSSEGSKASKTPTHVSMYDTEELQKTGSGLDREGMVLVALMSGGDYLPEGIPGAGVKLACEAARAGFGKSLCKLKKSDTLELATWKEWLTFELRHNESGFFRTRHKALTVPDSFPNLDVLGYYTHPVVSRTSTLDRLRSQSWDNPVDVQGLREFTRETFDWNYRIGAIKFIKVLAPCLLVRKMMSRSIQNNDGAKPAETLEKEELELVKSITSTRAHFSTDATPELRISFIPTKIVGYDFQEEPEEVIEYGRDGLALNSDDEFEAPAEDEAESVAKTGGRKPFNPTEPDLSWIPETIAKFGIPITVEDWEEAQRAKLAARERPKVPRQRGKKAGGMAAGALDKFVKVTKNIPRSKETDKDSTPQLPMPSSPVRMRSPLGISPIPSQGLPLPPPSPKGTPQNVRPTRSRLPKPGLQRLPKQLSYPLAPLRRLSRIVVPL
ncbi:PIN domain-like protein [Hypoxylon sp. EC38]|nr:PIN domain-like protein [Hypoxylon sp. EC38]